MRVVHLYNVGCPLGATTGTVGAIRPEHNIISSNTGQTAQARHLAVGELLEDISRRSFMISSFMRMYSAFSIWFSARMVPMSLCSITDPTPWLARAYQTKQISAASCTCTWELELAWKEEPPWDAGVISM